MIRKHLPNFYLGFAFFLGILVAGDLYSDFTSSGDILDLALLGLVVTLTLASAALGVIRRRTPQSLAALRRLIAAPVWIWRLVVFFALLTIESGGDLLFLRADLGPALYGRYQELLLENFSLLVGVFLFSLTSLLFLFGCKGLKGGVDVTTAPLFSRAFVLFTILAGLWVIVQCLGVGFQAGAEGQGFFQPLNPPLPGVQVTLILALVLAVSRIGSWLQEAFPRLGSLLDREALLLILLWGAAFALWMAVPVEANYYLDAPRPPNYAYALNSDSLYYEIESQRWLAGEGFGPLAYHPFYLAFLGVLHSLGGDAFLDIIWIQVLVLSLIPVLVYKLTASLHTRVSGLLAALLFMVRQRNSLLLMGTITVSNVKSVMTESLAILFLVLFMVLIAGGRGNSRRRRNTYLAAGGAIGVAVLIRVELLVIVPVLGVVAAFVINREKRLRWIPRTLPFLIGVILVVSPWMLRNWQRTGSIYIDKQDEFQEVTGYFEDRFLRLLPRALTPARLREEPSESGLGEGAFARGVVNHFSNDFMQLFLYLPSNHQPLLSLGSVLEIDPLQKGHLLSQDSYFSAPFLERYVKGLPYWRMDWDSALAPRSVFPLLVTLFLVSSGILAGLKRDDALTWLLILSVVGYMGIYALNGSSGGRYILTVDWIPLVFYAVGMVECLRLVRGEAGKTTAPGEIKPSPYPAGERGLNLSTFGIGFLVFLVGLFLPLSEAVIPRKYDRQGMQRALEEVLDPGSGLISAEDRERLQEALDEGAALRYGKAIFPRYYWAGERMLDDRDGEIPDYSYRRVEFFMVGFESTWAAVPRRDPPRAFPHGSEVIVLGLMQPEKRGDGERIHGSYLKARAVLILPGEDGPYGPAPIFSQDE